MCFMGKMEGCATAGPMVTIEIFSPVVQPGVAMILTWDDEKKHHFL
jgi:hypothetical protein